MKVNLKVLGLVVFGLLSGSARAEIIERIAAVINNDVITLSEVDDVVNSMHAATLEALSTAQDRSQKRIELRKQLLEQMIDQRVLTQQYDKLQITVTDQDIESTIDAIIRQNNITRDVLMGELERQGLSYLEYKDQMRQHLLQSRFIEQQIRPRINVSEEEVKNLYTRSIGELSGNEVVELVGVQISMARGGGPEAVETARKQADTARALLLKGTPPDEVARQSSDGSIKSLGEMGSFRRGELMDSLDAAVFSISAGEVTQPIESPVDSAVGLLVPLCVARWFGAEAATDAYYLVVGFPLMVIAVVQAALGSTLTPVFGG